jgi:uncharacterized protein YbgA (DUF1722 family)/uncharacterized protein YbbK (DUF523 family)
LGNKVRYDGQHKLDAFLTETLGKYLRWVPVCPEVECGLPIPREAMHLSGDPESPRLVTVKTGRDHTDRMLKWSKERLAELATQELCGFVFKSRSPSSGMKGVQIHTESGMRSRRGVGIFAREFMNAFPLVPVEDDGRLHDPPLRENFIERVFVYWRWKEFRKRGGNMRDLIAFHTDHKLLILSHSPRHYALLGSCIAGTRRRQQGEIHDNYIVLMMEGLKLIATTKKNTNVLQHMMGYFKKQLIADEKQELLDAVSQYDNGILPLIVPVVLFRHYVRKYDEPYLKRQFYLNPHPMELMLRNHV